MSADDVYFDRDAVTALARKIEQRAADLTGTVRIMEVCGTHTHAIAAAGLRRLLPAPVRLISGPGCPVCVTPVDDLDHAVALAGRDDVIICTFGDLIRVPASHTTLEAQTAEGCDIRIVYSPRDAVELARSRPDKQVVFLGVGFETTLPTIAGAIEYAEQSGVSNFLVLMGAKLIEPPLRALINHENVQVDAFLLPGHVSVIVGADFYRFLEREFGVPGVIVGFTPVDILSGVSYLLEQLRTGDGSVTNLYGRVVTPEGNVVAQELLAKYFEPCDTRWRGLGSIPSSGLRLRPAYRHRDASRLEVTLPPSQEPAGCRCGEVLMGSIEPPACPLFDSGCTPDTPVGACMVSGEGTCAAWYRHERVAMEPVR